MKRAVVALAGILAASGSHAGDQDPWEPFNRKIYAFNDVLDRWLLKPAAEGYRAVTPDLAERGISNFFGNIYEVRTITNDVLQGKFSQAGRDSTRFLLNTTVEGNTIIVHGVYPYLVMRQGENVIGLRRGFLK